MSFLSLFRRLFVLGFFAVCPMGALGYLLGGKQGAAIVLSLVALISVLIFFRAERAILSIYRVRVQAPEGLRRSLERVTARLGGRVPKVYSFSEAAPQALVARGPWSSGAILLSEGLLGALTEAELRELLEAAVFRVRSRSMRFQTVCAWLAHETLEFAPRPWIELLFGELRWHENLGVLGALRFVVLFSIARFFTVLGRGTQIDAPRVLSRLPVVSGEVSNPGSRGLHFLDPWASRGLLA